MKKKKFEAAKLFLKPVLLTGMLLTGCGIAIADNPEVQSAPADSTATQLEEVVVEGQNQMVTKEGITMLPTRDEKSHAYDAQTLLRNMAPPMLSFKNDMVTTVSGEDVNYYIDGIPATEADCASLRPSRVLKVEYFPFSSDPRFAGVNNVINFVMQPMEYGGYVRFNPVQYMGYTGGGYPLYAKFVRKSMHYDLVASADWNSTHSGGERKTEVFRGLDLTPDKEPVTRDYNTNESSQYHSYRAAFRALNIRANGSYLYSTLAFNYSSDRNNNDGYLSFSPELFPTSSANTRTHNRNISASWNGYAMLILPQNQYLHIVPVLKYSNSRNNSLYSPLLLSPILNNAKEIAWQPSVLLQYVKVINEKISLAVVLSSNTTIYSTDYSGDISAESAPHQTLTTSRNMLRAYLYHGLPRNAYYKVMLGGMLSYSKTASADAVTLVDPLAEVDFRYPFS